MDPEIKNYLQLIQLGLTAILAGGGVYYAIKGRQELKAERERVAATTRENNILVYNILKLLKRNYPEVEVSDLVQRVEQELDPFIKKKLEFY